MGAQSQPEIPQLAVGDQEGLHAQGPWVHHHVHARGVGFHTVIAGDEPSRPTVILLHDFPLHWWSWRNQIQELAEAGYRVMAIDLRGMGGSDFQPGSTELDELAEDVLAVANATGTNSFTVVGAGVGGQVAWAVAHINPEALKSCVVVSAPHPTSKSPRKTPRMAGESRFVVRRLRDGSLVESLLVDAAPSSSSSSSSSKEKMLRVCAAYQEPLQRKFAAAAALETLRATQHLSAATKKLFGRKVEVPVLAVTGADDMLVGVGETHWDPRLFKEVRQVSIENCGHYPNEEAPQVLTEILLDHLAGLSSPDKN